MNNSSRILRVVQRLVPLIALTSSAVTLACGPFLPSVRFVSTSHPDYPLSSYASGHLGVIQTGYTIGQLAYAYRTLTVGPPDASERLKLADRWRAELGIERQETDAVSLWESAFRRATGRVAPPVPRWSAVGEAAFSNCTQSALKAAAVTLTEMKAKRPADVQVFADNQARVFSACSERTAENLVPPPVGSSAEALDDYAYQQAAFDFYSMEYRTARKKFLDITKKKNSAWVGQARISAARALIRAATVRRDLPDLNMLGEADAELTAITKDSSMELWHGAAWQLISYCRIRIQPSEWLEMLVQQLSLKNPVLPVSTLVQDIQWLSEEHKLPDGPFKQWLQSMRKPLDKGLDTAFLHFRKMPNELWLVAALQEGDRNSPDALVDSALEVPPNSPAYLHASYHAIRIAQLRGRAGQVRERLNQILADKNLPPSSRNLFANLRLGSEMTWKEFWEDALKVQATQAGFSEFGSVCETKRCERAWGFDDEGANAFQSIPTAELIAIAETEERPELKRFLLLSAWSRAIVLRQDDLALKAAKAVAPLDSKFAYDLNAWENQPADRLHEEGVLLLAKLPGLSPRPPRNWIISQRTALTDSGAMAFNGWCGANSTGSTAHTSEFYPLAPTRLLQTAEEGNDRAKQEWLRLRALEPSPTYFAQEMLAWAEKAPTDPRVPEGLAWAVRSSRWGCKSLARTDVQRAFQVLQKKYGKTTWAAQTPQFW